MVTTRLVDLLEYVEHMVRLAERPVFSIRAHKNLLYFEHELQGRIGIHHDQQDENGSVWLKIDRLKRIDPPDVPEEIKAGVVYQSKQSSYELLEAGGMSYHRSEKCNPKRDEAQVLARREEIKKNWGCGGRRLSGKS